VVVVVVVMVVVMVVVVVVVVVVGMVVVVVILTGVQTLGDGGSVDVVTAAQTTSDEFVQRPHWSATGASRCRRAVHRQRSAHLTTIFTEYLTQTK